MQFSICTMFSILNNWYTDNIKIQTHKTSAIHLQREKKKKKMIENFPEFIKFTNHPFLFRLLTSFTCLRLSIK